MERRNVDRIAKIAAAILLIVILFSVIAGALGL
jgi:hypothetical protein